MSDIDIVLMRAESMKQFAGEDGTFIFGEWRAWEKACYKAGTWLDPKSFKSWTPWRVKYEETV